MLALLFLPLKIYVFVCNRRASGLPEWGVVLFSLERSRDDFAAEKGKPAAEYANLEFPNLMGKSLEIRTGEYQITNTGRFEAGVRGLQSRRNIWPQQFGSAGRVRFLGGAAKGVFVHLTIVAAYAIINLHWNNIIASNHQKRKPPELQLRRLSPYL